MENFQKNEKIRPIIKDLKVGESYIFHISKLKSVRTQASELGAIHNRQYKTKTDRTEQTISVTRVA